MIWLSCQGETWKCEMSAWVPCRGLLVSGGLIGFWRCADEAWDFGHNRRDSLLGTVGNGSRKTERCREETCTSRCPVFPPLSHNSIVPSPCCTVSGIPRALMPSQRLQRPTPAAPWFIGELR